MITNRPTKVAPSPYALIPFQIGGAILPSTDYDFSGITWEFADTAKPRHAADGMNDFFKRAPLIRGQFTFSGKYSCRSVRANQSTMQQRFAREIDLLNATQGVYSQALFFRPDTPPDIFDSPYRAMDRGDAINSDEDEALGTYAANNITSQELGGLCGCPDTPLCGEWFWARVKVSSVVTPSSMDVARGTSAVVSTDVQVMSPLMRVEWQHWRWGSPPPSRSGMTQEEMEFWACSPERDFFAPCTFPGCDSQSRWYFRDPRNMLYDTRLSPWRDLIGMRVYDVTGSPDSAMGIPTSCSFDPDFKIKAISGGKLVVKNERYGEWSGDLLAGEVIGPEFSWVNDTAINANRTTFPRLAPSCVNWFSYTGIAQIGIMERWL